MTPALLSDLAHGRSGDKGNHANVAVIAYTADGFAWLREHLTAEAVRHYFEALGPSRVVRYEAANLLALNSCCTTSWPAAPAGRCAATRRARH